MNIIVRTADSNNKAHSEMLSESCPERSMDSKYEFNNDTRIPIISNLERNLAITGTLLMAYGTALPHYEIIARAHYFAQLAMAEAERRVNHDISER